MPSHQGLGARGTTGSIAKTWVTPRHHTLLNWGLNLVWTKTVTSGQRLPIDHASVSLLVGEETYLPTYYFSFTALRTQNSWKRWVGWYTRVTSALGKSEGCLGT